MQWDWYYRLYSDHKYSIVTYLFTDQGIEETEVHHNGDREFILIPYEFIKYPFSV